MLRPLFRRSVLTSGLICVLALGLATPSQACCFFNWFNGWGHSSYYRGPVSYYSPSSCCGAGYGGPAYAPSGCSSCGYGPVAYGAGGCATGNCGVAGSCGTESTTYESPETGESKKEPLNPDEMEPVPARGESGVPDIDYNPQPDPDLSDDARWEGNGRRDFRNEATPEPNPGTDTAPPDFNFGVEEPAAPDLNEGFGTESLPDIESGDFNSGINGDEPAANPTAPDAGAPIPREQRNNNDRQRLFDDAFPNNDRTPETEIERETAKPITSDEGEVKAEENPTADSPAEAPADEAPVSTPEEIESTEEETGAEEGGALLPLNLDNQFSLHTPSRTRLRAGSTPTVRIPELVRQPVRQKSISKSKTKGPQLVSR